MRHREQERLVRGPGQPADVAVERDAGRLRGGARDGHRDAEDGVGAEPALGRRAVEVVHLRVEFALVHRLADDGRGQFAVDVADRLQHALAEVARLVAVPQLERLALAG